MKQQVPINPALLRWARCAVGLGLKDAAARAKITALYCGWLIKTKINEAINYFRDEASGYL